MKVYNYCVIATCFDGKGKYVPINYVIPNYRNVYPLHRYKSLSFRIIKI